MNDPIEYLYPPFKDLTNEQVFALVDLIHAHNDKYGDDGRFVTRVFEESGYRRRVKLFKSD